MGTRVVGQVKLQDLVTNRTAASHQGEGEKGERVQAFSTIQHSGIC